MIDFEEATLAPAGASALASLLVVTLSKPGKLNVVPGHGLNDAHRMKPSGETYDYRYLGPFRLPRPALSLEPLPSAARALFCRLG